MSCCWSLMFTSKDGARIWIALPNAASKQEPFYTFRVWNRSRNRFSTNRRARVEVRIRVVFQSWCTLLMRGREVFRCGRFSAKLYSQVFQYIRGRSSLVCLNLTKIYFYLLKKKLVGRYECPFASLLFSSLKIKENWSCHGFCYKLQLTVEQLSWTYQCLLRCIACMHLLSVIIN